MDVMWIQYAVETQMWNFYIPKITIVIVETIWLVTLAEHDKLINQKHLMLLIMLTIIFVFF
jgi:hypothetical protein